MLWRTRNNILTPAQGLFSSQPFSFQWSAQAVGQEVSQDLGAPSPTTQVPGPTKRTKERQAVGIRGGEKSPLPKAHKRIREEERESVKASSFDSVLNYNSKQGTPSPPPSSPWLSKSHLGWLSWRNLDKTLTMCQNGLFLNVIPESTRILSWSKCCLEEWRGCGRTDIRREGGGLRFADFN